MKINFLTVAVFLIAAYVIRSTAHKLRKNEVGTPMAATWITLWAAIGICALFPSITEFFIGLVDVGKRVIFALLVAVIILFSLVYNLSFRLEKCKRDIAELTQELALLNRRLGNKDNAKQALHIKTRNS